MKRKVTAVLGIMGIFATASVAFAQTITTGDPVPLRTQPTVLQVSSGGRVLLRGTIDAISSGTLTVKSWGGDWTIDVATTSTKVLPYGATLSSFQQGDFVGVLGTVSQSSGFTVNATLVRDWTARQALNQQIRQNIQAVRQEKRSMTPRNYQGTLSNLDASTGTFTLTTGAGTNYTVSLTSSAEVLKRNWVTLNFNQVQNGNTVVVWGPMASSTISASVFRDLSM